MKFILTRHDGQLHLILRDGREKLLSVEEARELVANFDSVQTEGSSTCGSPCSPDQREGECLVTLEDDGKLVVHEAKFLRELLSAYDFPYLTTEEFAQKHGRQQARVKRLCQENRIEGAFQKGHVWLIPKNAKYPADARAGRDMSKRYAKKEG